MFTVSLHWPQITFLLILFVILVRTVKTNWDQLCGMLCFWATIVVLLCFGGFFSQANAQEVLAAAPRYRAELTRAAQTKWGLDAPVPAFAAQVHQESAWRPDAVSRVGAQGMAQFMPATASWWCTLNKLTPAECQPTNATWALRAMVGYDKWLWDRLPEGLSARDRMWATLRAYNGGLGHWQAEAKLAAGTSRQAVDAACGKARRAPVHCAENLAYPARILNTLQPRYAAWGPVL